MLCTLKDPNEQEYGSMTAIAALTNEARLPEVRSAKCAEPQQKLLCNPQTTTSLRGGNSEIITHAHPTGIPSLISTPQPTLHQRTRMEQSARWISKLKPISPGAQNLVEEIRETGRAGSNVYWKHGGAGLQLDHNTVRQDTVEYCSLLENRRRRVGIGHAD